MLNTLGEMKNAILVKNQASTTMTFFTDDILNDYINEAYMFAASYKKWPFTEQLDKNVAYVAGTEVYDYPSNFKSDSIRFLQVGTQSFRKLNFTDYQKHREARSDGDDLIFTDIGRQYFINPKADASGTVSAWGQYRVAQLDGSVPAGTTVFSGSEEYGNSAIVEEAMSFVKLREKKPDEANFHHKRSVEILERIWSLLQDEQFTYHSKGSMFEWIDILNGQNKGDLPSEDRFY